MRVEHARPTQMVECKEYGPYMEGDRRDINDRAASQLYQELECADSFFYFVFQAFIAIPGTDIVDLYCLKRPLLMFARTGTLCVFLAPVSTVVGTLLPR